MAKRGVLDPEVVAKLIAATKRQSLVPEDDELLGGNEGERRLTSSIFGDLFDVLSRPARASAGAAFAATDNDPNTDVVGGLLQGLSGKTNHSYSDVIKNVAPGLPGPLRAVGGFAGDVLLDPLTYAGVKTVKGTSLSEGRIRAVRELAQSGQDILPESVDTIAKRIAADDPTKTFVQFAGKKITPDFTAPAAAGNKIKDKIIGDEGHRRKGAQLFSRNSEMPFGLSEDSRILEAQNAGFFEKHNKHLGQFFGGLSPQQSREVMFALEQGRDLSDMVLDEASRKPGINTLEDYKRVAQTELKRMFDDEAKLGLYDPKQFNPNYVYKYFRGKDVPEELSERLPGGAGIKRGSDPGVKAAMKELVDLEGAERLGLDPLLDVGEMMQMRAAKHYRTMGRQGFVKEAILGHGVKGSDLSLENRQSLRKMKYGKTGDSLSAKIAHTEELKDYYLPESVLKAIEDTEVVLKDGRVGGEAVRWFDKTMNIWKKFNTSYNPGYHVRNSMSDGIINYMDGVHNPTLYERSGRALRAVGQADADDVLGGIHNPHGKEFGLLNIGRHNKVTPLELWDLYLKAGSKAGLITTEISPALDPNQVAGVSKHIDRLKTVTGGKAQDFEKKLSGWADKREDFFRLAHHIKAMEDNLPKNRQATPEELLAASMEAGKRVRKFNIDYGQLSTFERNTMRRVFPFYGWMRRNLPLQVELLFTKPGYMATYPKGQDLLQGLLGTEDGEGDYMIPKWIRDLAPVRLALGDNEKNTFMGKILKKLAGAENGEAVFTNLATSQTPIGDLETLLEPIAQGIESGDPMETVKGGFNKLINMASPVVKAPYELGTGNSTFTGRPIEETGGWADWLASQIGPTRMGASVAQGDVRAGTSWLLGVGLQPVTKERQAGEFRRREDVLQGRINQEQAAGMAERVPEELLTNDLLNKYKNLDIVKMQQYIKNNRRIIQGMNGVQ